MGRTLLVADTIAEIDRRINSCKSNKRKLLDYVQEIKDKCLNHEITYSEYEALINEKKDGKTIQEWLDQYDSYIEDCKKRIKQQKRKSKTKKILTVFLSFIFVFILILSVFYLRPVIMGLIVKETQEFSQTLNLKIEESTDYEWQLEHPGQLQSVKLSGTIEHEGEVKIYLDDLLILDSSKLKSNKAKLTGGVITGLATEETEEKSILNMILGFFTNIFSKITGRAAEEGAEEPAPEPATEPEPESEPEQEEAPQPESPSQETQEEPLSSGTEPASTSGTEPASSETEEAGEEEPTEEIEEEETEEPAEEEEEEEPEEEIEEEAEEVPEEEIEEIKEPGAGGVPEEKEEEEIEITIKQFTEICEETCNLKKLNLSKSSYTLKIEISNAKLNLDEIKYEVIPAEIPEEEPKEEIPEENITEEVPEEEIPENITEEVPEIPENITEINITKPPEINITLPPILIKEIPNIEIEKNKFIEIDLTEYFSDTEQHFLLQTQNISTTTYDHTIRIQPEQDFTGTRTMKIIALNSLGKTESNFFNITVSEFVKAPALIRNIPDMQIQKNSYAEINIAEYFSDAEKYYLLQTKNITTTIYDHTIKIQPDKDFTGTRKSKIIASNSFGAVESNFFNVIVSEVAVPEILINITEENATITTTQYQAVIGEPVKWKKHVQLEEPGIIKIKLPKEAKNITVNKIIEGPYSEEIEEQEEAPQPESPSQETQEEPLSSGTEPASTSGTEPASTSGIGEEAEETEPETEEAGEEEPTEEIPEEEEETEEPAEEEEVKEEIPEEPSEKVKEKEEKPVKPEKQEAKATITGVVISEEKQTQETSILTSISNFFRKIFSTITGRATTTEEIPEENVIEVIIEDTGLEYEIEYETPAPQAIEQEISARKKIITISGPETVHYENVLAYTELPQETLAEKIRLYRTTNGTREPVQFTTQDLNNNNLIDYIEWLVPRLSNETYELVIEISRAEHLDENKTFISDIYDEVYQLDDIWSEPIPAEHYIRVTFRQNLTSDRDITIYPRIISGQPRIEVYEQDGSEIIAEFTSLTSNQYNKIFLTNLISESQDVFDLRVVNGAGEFDYIVDPSAIFFDDFDDNNLDGWTISSIWAPAADGPPGSSYYAHCEKALSGETMDKAVSTANYESIVFSFHAITVGLDVGEYLLVDWYNGTDWLTELNEQTIGSWTWYSFPLDTSAENNADFQIRFTCDSGNAEYCGVDNVQLNGTAGDTEFPIFSDYYDNNGSLLDSGTALFNVTIMSTNGTVGLDINNGNETAFNESAEEYNVSVTLATGTYSYYWWAYGNGTSNKYNTSALRSYTVNASITPPNVTIDYPSQQNYSQTWMDFNLTVVDDNADLEGCWYTLNSGTDNTTMSNDTASNFYHTNTTIADNTYTANFYCNDSNNNVNNTELITFTIDLTPPTINITYPPNETNTKDTNIDVNYTVSDGDLQACWYSNDSFSENVSLTCGNNITSLIWVEGLNNVTVWANDTSGNENSSSIIFTIDTANPGISIVYPSNGINTSDTDIDVNYSVSDINLQACWYSNDSFSENVSLTCGNNITSLIWVEGLNNVTVWANDSIGNENSSSIIFTIDLTPPDINITYPPDGTNTSDTNIDVNYSVSDGDLQACWYSNDSFSENVSLTCGNNITSLIWVEGLNNVTVWANDTSGNENSSSIIFTIDTTNPDINITYPQNITYSINVTELNYTVSDSGAGLDSCWYSLDEGATNSTPDTNCNNFTGLSGTDNSNTWTAYANDTSGNENSSSVTFYNTYITRCRILSQANTEYTLGANIINDSLTVHCINITAQNITFNGNGYYISSDDDYAGVYSNQLNTTIKNCNISMGAAAGEGIRFGANANDSSVINCTLHNQDSGFSAAQGPKRINIKNNTIFSHKSNGISFGAASDYDTIDSNVIYNNSYGIYATGTYINITNNIINISSTAGIYLEEYGHRVENNTFNSNAVALYIENAYNNNFINNTIWNCTTTTQGCIYIGYSHDSNFSGGIVNQSSNYLIHIYTNPTATSDDNKFQDMQLLNPASGKAEVYMETQYDAGATSTDNIFLNVTYTNDTIVQTDGGGAASIIRKWYYRAYVNDSNDGSAIEGTNITAYNASDIYQFNLTTDENGLTAIENIIDYVNNGTRSYYSLYTIYAQNTSYPTTSHQYNVTSNENNLKDVFSLDNIYPNVNIVYPSNGINTSDTNIDVNYSVSDINLQACWYSNDSFSENVSLTCGNNITSLIWVEGLNNVTVWANDSTGNENSSSIIFTIDTVLPTVNIIYPLNNSNFNTNMSIELNYTVSDLNLDSCWYTINNGADNSSLTCGTNSTLNVTDETITTVIVYANDSANSINLSSVVIYADTIYPTINFTSPTPDNASTPSADAIYVNLSSNDSNDHYAFVDFNSDLVLWMRMDDVNQTTEGALVEDLSTYSNNGTAKANAVQTDAGYYGKGFSFDGTGDYVEISSSSSLNFDASENYTWSAWIKPLYNTQDYGIIAKQSIGASGIAIVVAEGGQNAWYARVFDMKNVDAAAASSTFSSGEWYHVAVTYNNGTAQIYVNGTADGSGSKTFTDDTTNNVNIGNTPGFYNPFYGTIDEVLIFNRSLNSSEISALYNASANQYYNNFTSLADGTHTFTGYAVDKAGNKNETEQRQVITETGTGVSICRELSQANTEYTMTANIENNDLSSACINITAQNITFVGDGYYISSNNDYTGIYSNQINTTIKNCNVSMGTGSGGFGIGLIQANNSYILNNTLNSQGWGLYLGSTYHTKIENTTLNSNTLNGMYISSSSNNNLSGIIANSNTQLGIYLVTDSNNNYLSNITLNSNLYGLAISSSSNNNLTNINIWNCTTTSVGCLYITQSQGNTFTGGVINLSASNLIYLNTNSDNNTFQNMELINSAENDTYLTGTSINNTFLNVSYNINKEYVDSGSELVRKGYFTSFIANVTYVGDNSAISGANVSLINDPGATLLKSNLTDSEGLATLNYSTPQLLTFYVNTGTRTAYLYLSTELNPYITETTAPDYTTILQTKSYVEGDNISVTMHYSTYNVAISQNLHDIYTAINDTRVFTNHSSASEPCHYIANASLNVTSGGKLIIENCTLEMASLAGYLRTISITDGGNLIMNYSNLTAYDTSMSYNLYSVRGSDLTLKNSYINYLGTADSNYRRGLEINSTSLVFDNITMYKNSMAITLWAPDLVISNSSISGSTSLDYGDNVRIAAPGIKILYCNISDPATDRFDIAIDANMNVTVIGSNYTDVGFQSGSQLFKKWYYRAYVNDTSGNSVSAANVTAYNVSDVYQFNLTTDSTGYTETEEIIDYVQTSGGITHYSNYTIFASNDSYTTGSHSYNVTDEENNLKDVFTLTSNNAPDNPSPEINSTDHTNRTNQDLNCFDTITDQDSGDLLNVTVVWYNNTLEHLIVDYNNNYINDTFFNALLASDNTSAGENWSCGMRLYDGADYSDWINSSNLTILNNAPNITYVSSISNTNPVEGNYVSIQFNITMDDVDGVSDLNDTSVQANFSRTNEALRQNLSCLNISGETTSTSQNFSCTIDMWYWDGYGNWNITVHGEDNYGASVLNDTTTFQYNVLYGITISPSILTFNVTIGATNETANEYTTVNNTGNYNITGNISVTGVNLWSGAYFIDVGNFTVDTDTGDTPPAECDGFSLQNETNVTIETAILEKGNLSDGKANETIYYCLTKVPSTIPSGTYDTSTGGSWTITIRVLIVLFIYSPQVKSKKKQKSKKKLKRKPAEDDKLVKALNLIVDELKEEYSLNKKEIIEIIIEKLRTKYKISRKEIVGLIKAREELNIPITIFSKKLGALEAVSKYMKENLGMNYHEIAKLLNRNERTIWTAYKKATEKQKEPIKTRETEIFLPVSIFKNRKLTVLESGIIYLKAKGLKHNKIAKLLDRDQRNIWTIYSRAVNKIKRKV